MPFLSETALPLPRPPAHSLRRSLRGALPRSALTHSSPARIRTVRNVNALKMKEITRKKNNLAGWGADIGVKSMGKRRVNKSSKKSCGPRPAPAQPGASSSQAATRQQPGSNEAATRQQPGSNQAAARQQPHPAQARSTKNTPLTPLCHGQINRRC